MKVKAIEIAVANATQYEELARELGNQCIQTVEYGPRMVYSDDGETAMPFYDVMRIEAPVGKTLAPELLELLGLS